MQYQGVRNVIRMSESERQREGREGGSCLGLSKVTTEASQKIRTIRLSLFIIRILGYSVSQILIYSHVREQA